MLKMYKYIINKDKIQINEYEKIIEESFNKIKELQTNLLSFQEKNSYLEKLITDKKMSKYNLIFYR